jgi:hypothetical protein
MNPQDSNVKPGFPRRLGRWIDSHPRTGWYVAAWATVVSLNTILDLIDRLLGL